MTRIDYFYFPLSPYTYLAGTGLEEIAARHDADIHYRPFNLFEVFAATGTALPKDRHVSRQQYRIKDIARTAKAAGLPVNLKPAHWPTDPVPASSAVIVAQEAGGGDLGALCHGILRAVWAEDRNIAEPEVIADCLKAAGFDPHQNTAAVAGAAEIIALNTSEALERMVFGAPSYVVGDEVFWGGDRLGFLDAYLTG